MKILIYDDSHYDREEIKNCIITYFSNKEVEYSISICKSTEDLLENIFLYDLCFLDIELADENGIDIGLRIRNINKYIRIILVSNYSKYLIDGYKIHADRYFIKPLDQNELTIELESIMLNYLMTSLNIQDDRISKDRIYFNNILYIEVKNRKTILNLLDGQIIYTSLCLKELMKLLNEGTFAQSHKSYYINLMYMRGYKKAFCIKLTNGIELPLSRFYRNDFNKEYTRFLHGGW